MDFTLAVNRVLTNEGGYVNNPKDPGGETKWGISKRSYPHLDIKNLTREAAVNIYYSDFWQRLGLASMGDVLAYQALDFAVNAGAGGMATAVRKLQWALGVADDGIWGPVSAGALARANQAEIAVRFMQARILYTVRLSNWHEFAAGWANRWAADLGYMADDIHRVQGGAVLRAPG